jgi:hypothetical protein
LTPAAKSIALAAFCLAAPLLSGCAATSSFVADTMPTWMGGLPADAPPRPSDPRYAEYERAQKAKEVKVSPANAGTGQAK